MIEQDFNRIAAALEKLVLIQSAARFTFKLNFGKDFMRTYKADRPDFDFMIEITATDSEGNVINNSPVPAGYTLTVTSDNPAGFSVVQDAGDPRLCHAHIGGPNGDGSPSQSIVTANLTDPAGNLNSTDAEMVVVTTGDPFAISSINFNLPE